MKKKKWVLKNVSNACPGQPLKKMPKITNATNTFPPPANPKPLFFFNFEFLDVGHFFSFSWFGMLPACWCVVVLQKEKREESKWLVATVCVSLYSFYVSIRQHTSTHVSIRHTCPHTSYVSAYVMRQQVTCGYYMCVLVLLLRQHTSAYVSILHTCPHTSYVSRATFGY